jgi:LuxR family maltose regulon positive regulatory protein
MRRMARSHRDLAPVPARPRGGTASPAPIERLRAVGPGRPGQPDRGIAAPAAGAVDAAWAPSAPRELDRTSTVSELDVFGFPVQIGKVQPPLLPAETLARDRLLDWMAAKIHSRLVLICADPGHGKTTLLADWTRRTRVRALWYRLDETDRDWVVFVHHVVAAGREIDAAFAPNTASLLRELGAGMGDRASIVRTLLAEIRAWVTAGTALLLDDYQVIDDVPEVREIVRELVLRGPDRLSIVISTRRPPTLPLARLRALGEVAELSTADLRFDRSEMERLFRETYRHPLEADLLDDLARTTEGWAATLRLVETAVRGRPRSEVRAVIRSLSAQHGDLHDYLAEEVVGRMPLELQAFLERCSLLHVATPQLAGVAAAVTEEDARRLLDVTEEAGLLSRRGRTGQAGRLLHPLVRSFLEGRLLEAVGPDGVAEIHVRIAAAAEGNSWWLAAYHYAAARRGADVARVLSSSLEAILGSGGAQAAVDLMTGAGPLPDAAWFMVLLARRYLAEGRLQESASAADAAWGAVSQGDSSAGSEWVLMTLITVSFARGDYAGGAEWAQRLEADSLGFPQAVARAILAISDSTVQGSLDRAAHLIEDTARLSSALGHKHFHGISMLNLGWVNRYRGLVSRVAEDARAAQEALSETSAKAELPTAHVLLAWALAHQGDFDTARAELAQARVEANPATQFEMLVETSDVIGLYVDPDEAADLLVAARTSSTPNSAADEALFLLTSAENALRLGRIAQARADLEACPEDLITGHPAFASRRSVAFVGLCLAEGRDVDLADLDTLASRVREQGAGHLVLIVQLIRGAIAGADSYSRAAARIADAEPPILSACAEILAPRLPELSSSTLQHIQQEAERRPQRWRPALRRASQTAPPQAALAAARMLELVGDATDVPALRNLSRSLKGEFRRPDLGRSLARRIAPRVWVEDQGRIVVRVGEQDIPGTAIRRKALSLLSYLLTRPGFSASRDQVLDALWPEQDPDQTINSLHQSVYFLRRVFEPAYTEDLSPGYVNHDPDLLWLDTELVDSRSTACRRLLERCGRPPDPAQVALVADQYRGPFALDFAYEEWASPYRENLHARFLETLESAIQADIEDGHVARAISLSRRVLEVDPQVDDVERTLLRLYRTAGAHAAAAEQYGHYAETLRRDLGVDPPGLDDI